jgi:hypothetical protein
LTERKVAIDSGETELMLDTEGDEALARETAMAEVLQVDR